MEILGVRIDNLTKKEILERIGFFLSERKFHQIATVNPEFILQAQKNEKFKNILNGSDLNIADGFGVGCAFLKNFKFLKSRIAGTDLMHEILSFACKNDHGVYLAVNKFGLSTFEEIKKKLEKTYPTLQISGADFDPKELVSWPVISNQEIVLCNFGAPDQEVFINSVKNDSIRLAMGVGGSFDFVAGKVKRAPKSMRILGLEWLWRFSQQPRYRFRRIINAVIVFPIKVLIKKG